MIATAPARWIALAGRQPSVAGCLACFLAADRSPEPSAGVRQDDEDDVRDSRDGDPEAYRRLVERYQPEVSRMMWRFTRDRNEHEELAQQVFVEAYLSLSSYRAKAPFGHWLAGIATRVGYRHWRTQTRHRRTRLLPEEMWARMADAAAHGQVDQESADLVHHLLAQLPPSDRLVLTLRYLEQHDIEQTARLIGWSKVRVRVRTHRAIGKLRNLAAEAGIELEA